MGRCVSFQITILKVLAGSPDGRLSLADLRHDVALLMTSGRDWTDRTRRIAARAPNLDIFSQAFVLRDPTGWQITASGREFLTSVNKPCLPLPSPAQAELVVVDSAVMTSPPPPLVGLNPRRQRLRRRRRQPGTARSAVA
jgi:hypothetical protein